MKRSYCLLALLILLINVAFAETLALQSFEASASDTWGYTANPVPSRLIYWGPTTEAMGGATAYNGTYYWAGWDLDNVVFCKCFSDIMFSLRLIYFVQ